MDLKLLHEDASSSEILPLEVSAGRRSLYESVLPLDRPIKRLFHWRIVEATLHHKDSQLVRTLANTRELRQRRPQKQTAAILPPFRRSIFAAICDEDATKFINTFQRTASGLFLFLLRQRKRIREGAREDSGKLAAEHLACAFADCSKLHFLLAALLPVHIGPPCVILLYARTARLLLVDDLCAQFVFALL